MLILFTVTFCANPANDLTRPPSYITIYNVPISLLFRKDAWGSGAKPAAPMPMLLDGYGSYAYCNDPYFDADILPLLDRGAIWAVAHVRGGGEMGRATWYEDGGKFERKSNTFSDFVACARALVAAEITTSDALAIEGRSAGGLLVGAVLNRADAYEYDARGVATKSLFAAAVAGVPFVDVMATMSDASIPLTCGEWEEWGNPHEEKAFKDMLDYSPVDNVVPRPYPALLATAGLHDSVRRSCCCRRRSTCFSLTLALALALSLALSLSLSLSLSLLRSPPSPDHSASRTGSR